MAIKLLHPVHPVLQSYDKPSPYRAICHSKLIVSLQLVKKQGAHAVFDYKKPVPEQIQEVLAIAKKGKVHRVFDAAATGDEFAKGLFKELKEEPKLFSSTNTWYARTQI